MNQSSKLSFTLFHVFLGSKLIFLSCMERSIMFVLILNSMNGLLSNIIIIQLLTEVNER